MLGSRQAGRGKGDVGMRPVCPGMPPSLPHQYVYRSFFSSSVPMPMASFIFASASRRASRTSS